MLHICKSILHHINTFVLWIPQKYRQKLKYRTKSLQYSKKNATFARDFGKKRCKSENSQVCSKQHLMHYFPKEYNSFGKSFSVIPFSWIFHCVRNTIKYCRCCINLGNQKVTKIIQRKTTNKCKFKYRIGQVCPVG